MEVIVVTIVSGVNDDVVDSLLDVSVATEHVSWMAIRGASDEMQ